MNEDGTIKNSLHDMELIAETFYTNLFRSTIPIPDPNIPAGEKPPGTLPSEFRVAIENMKRGTAPGPDNVTADFLRAEFTCNSRKSFNNLPSKGKNPRPVEDVAHGHPAQERDRMNLRNYRPICLLGVFYKLFTKIVLSRIPMTLDETQPVEQAGFRKEFCCMDHIQTVSLVIEVCQEYHLPLVLIFVDYEKAFDTVETNAILSALVDQGVDPS